MKKKHSTAKAERKTKKSQATPKRQKKAAEYVNHLLELHKLQGVLLVQMREELS